MVRLTPEHQADFVEKAPEVFALCTGAWGRAGCTSVHLAVARSAAVKAVLEAAAANASRNPARRASRKS